MRREDVGVFLLSHIQQNNPLFHWPWFLLTGDFKNALCHVANELLVI
jgi:hypothetical protein